MDFAWANESVEEGVLMLARQKVAVDLFGPFVKEADAMSSINSWVASNPGAAKALLGAGIGSAAGGLVGGLASSRSGRKRPWAGALTGALVGGGLGALGGYGAQQLGESAQSSHLTDTTQALANAEKALKVREDEIPIISPIAEGMTSAKTDHASLANPVIRDAIVGGTVLGGAKAIKGQVVDSKDFKSVNAVPNEQIKKLIDRNEATDANFGKQVRLGSGGWGRPLVSKQFEVPNVVTTQQMQDLIAKGALPSDFGAQTRLPSGEMGHPVVSTTGNVPTKALKAVNDKALVLQPSVKFERARPAMMSGLKGGVASGLASLLARYYSAGQQAQPTTQELKQNYDKAYKDHYRATQQATPMKKEGANPLSGVTEQLKAWYAKQDPHTQKALIGGGIGLGLGGLTGVVSSRKRRGLSGLLGALAGGAAGAGAGYGLQEYGVEKPPKKVGPVPPPPGGSPPVLVTDPEKMTAVEKDVTENIVPYVLGGGGAAAGGAYLANKYLAPRMPAIAGRGAALGNMLKNLASKARGKVTPRPAFNTGMGGINIKPIPGSTAVKPSVVSPPAMSVPPSTAAVPDGPVLKMPSPEVTWSQPKKPIKFPQ